MDTAEAEGTALAEHLPQQLEDELLHGVRERYPQWEISREDAHLVATHIEEVPDHRLQRAGIYTTITAPTIVELEPRLFVQEALRGDGAASQ